MNSLQKVFTHGIPTETGRPQGGETVVRTDDVGSVKTGIQIEYILIQEGISKSTEERGRMVLCFCRTDQTGQGIFYFGILHVIRRKIGESYKTVIIVELGCLVVVIVRFIARQFRTYNNRKRMVFEHIVIVAN